MNEPNKPQIDQAASDAVRRVETQMRLDGKLNKAMAVEGGAILLLLPTLAILGGLSAVLGLLGFSDEGRIVVGTILITAGFLWASYQMAKRSAR